MVFRRFHKMIFCLLLLGANLPAAALGEADDSIGLEDGTRFRLADVWTPYELFWNDLEAQAVWQANYNLAVAAWRSTHAYVPRLSGDEDRYGRSSGDFEAADGTSLRAHLLAQGLAVAAKGQALRLFEADARVPGIERGIWEGTYRALCQDVADEAVGSFGVIVGRVENAAVVGRTIYLNFGQDWRQDFTVSKRITRDEERPDTEALKGTWVEARGWVEWRGGPAIVISDWSQVEALGTNDFQKKGCE